ncbi:hypothetical protein [Clostridium perfringens]|uniref:hypothetical protein n=1 Tax=Clostridium perfringens TaxID=1502 RepID=UPI0024BC2C74|nr:hypothetical protein [Clostridium perfringens]
MQHVTINLKSGNSVKVNNLNAILTRDKVISAFQEFNLDSPMYKFVGDTVVVLRDEDIEYVQFEFNK